MASSRINERQLSELFGLLRSVKDWADLERRLAVAVRRNGTASTRDGFADGNGIPSMPARGAVGGDRTGAKAVASAEGHARRDPLDEHTVAAVRGLEQAVVGIQALRSRLDAIDHLSRPDDLNPEPGCVVMAKVGVWEPVHVISTVKGKLKEPAPLGRWAYEFVRATGTLPSREQARAHADGRRIRLKV